MGYRPNAPDIVMVPFRSLSGVDIGEFVIVGEDAAGVLAAHADKIKLNVTKQVRNKRHFL